MSPGALALTPYGVGDVIAVGESIEVRLRNCGSSVFFRRHSEVEVLIAAPSPGNKDLWSRFSSLVSVNIDLHKLLGRSKHRYLHGYQIC